MHIHWIRPGKKAFSFRSSSKRRSACKVDWWRRTGWRGRTVGLEVLLGGRDELDGGKLEAIRC